MHKSWSHGIRPMLLWSHRHFHQGVVDSPFWLRETDFFLTLLLLLQLSPFFFFPLLYNLFSPICFPWEREKWGNLAGPRGHAFVESENSSFCNRCIIFWLLGMQTGRESLERRRGARGIWLPTPLYASLHWVFVLTQLLLSVHHNIYKYIIAVENILVTSSDAGFIFPSRFLQIAGYVKVKLFFWVGHISWVWSKPPRCMIIVAR